MLFIRNKSGSHDPGGYPSRSARPAWIAPQLGKGGMGEGSQAKDNKLARDAAIAACNFVHFGVDSRSGRSGALEPSTPLLQDVVRGERYLQLMHEEM